MKVSKLGYGLVAACFALSLGLAACKTDKKTAATSKDSGTDAAAVTADAGGGDAGGAVTETQCVDMTTTTTMGMIASTCVSCVCANAIPEAVACNATCWGLINCYALNCKDTASGPDVACASTKCMAYIAGIGGAMPLGVKITASCKTECAPVLPDAGMTSPDAGGGSGNDAGGDAGN